MRARFCVATVREIRCRTSLRVPPLRKTMRARALPCGIAAQARFPGTFRTSNTDEAPGVVHLHATVWHTPPQLEGNCPSPPPPPASPPPDRFRNRSVIIQLHSANPPPQPHGREAGAYTDPGDLHTRGAGATAAAENREAGVARKASVPTSSRWPVTRQPAPDMRHVSGATIGAH